MFGKGGGVGVFLVACVFSLAKPRTVSGKVAGTEIQGSGCGDGERGKGGARMGWGVGGGGGRGLRCEGGKALTMPTIHSHQHTGYAYSRNKVTHQNINLNCWKSV